MAAYSEITLPLEQQLALAHSTGEVRTLLDSFLQFDNRLARFVSKANEPIVTQLRLAWWRDQLNKPLSERPSGDTILDALSAHWEGGEAVLVGLVDGWEALLGEPPLPDDVFAGLCAARATCFAEIVPQASIDDAKALGLSWAYADFITRTSDEQERAHLVDLAKQAAPGTGRLNFRYRSLTILGRLGARAIERSGSPMLGRRRDALLVTRIGLLGL